jgi:hypothetical protein
MSASEEGDEDVRHAVARPDLPSREALARRRYVTIGHTIPDRLDCVAQLLNEVLGQVHTYRLDEALQPTVEQYRTVVEGLGAAAERLRLAAELIPEPGRTP